MPRRPDAELVKTTKFHEIEFHIMRKKTQSEIHFQTQVDLTHTHEFLEKYNRDKDKKEKLTLFQIYLTAAVRTITLRPRINRFVSGRRLWQRNRIVIAFVVKKDKTEGGEEINAMIEFDPFDNLAAVQKIVNKTAAATGEPAATRPRAGVNATQAPTGAQISLLAPKMDRREKYANDHVYKRFSYVVVSFPRSSRINRSTSSISSSF